MSMPEPGRHATTQPLADSGAPQGAGLRILAEDEELIAIDKPAGLLVHPSALDRHETESVTQCLAVQMGVPVWPLHRLDKATSGVLVLARGRESAQRWRKAFEAGTTHKHYQALVRGWTPDEGLIDYALARDPEQASANQERLAASTRFKTLSRYEWPIVTHPLHAGSRYSLVSIWPLTGRRHQIRRHFKHIAHPLVGDTTHGKGEHNRAVATWLGMHRLWLHACSIELWLPDAPTVKRRFEAPLGSEWASLGPSGLG